MAKSLWFKAEFVDSILRGEKTDTMRKASSRLPSIGDVVRLQVGPRPAFAEARVIAIVPIAIESLSPERAAQVRRCYPGQIPPLVQIEFAIVR